MPAAAVGLPVWTAGVWADTLWESGFWASASGGPYTLVLGTGAYAVAGQALTLTYAPVGGGPYTLVLGAGDYAVTGSALVLTYSETPTAGGRMGQRMRAAARPHVRGG